MLNRVISRLKGKTGHHRSEDVRSQLIMPSGAPPLSFSHLSTHNLRGATSQDATQSVGKLERPSLRALAEAQVRAERSVTWNVQYAKVRCCLDSMLDRNKSTSSLSPA